MITLAVEMTSETITTDGCRVKLLRRRKCGSKCARNCDPPHFTEYLADSKP
jgi:hypothetical protein